MYGLMYGLVLFKIGLMFLQELIISLLWLCSLSMFYEADSEIILQKVSDGEPNIHPNEGNQPLSVWMKPMNEQNDQSVVFVRVQSLANGDGPQIDIAIPRRQWPSLKIKHPILKKFNSD